MARVFYRFTAFAFCWFPAGSALSQVAFVPDTLQLAGAGKSVVIAFIRVEDPELTPWTLEAVDDLGPIGGGEPASTKVTFSGCSKVSSSRTDAEWKCTVEVDPLPSVTSSARNAKLTFAPPSRILAKTRANGNAAAPFEEDLAEPSRSEPTQRTIRSARYKLSTRASAPAWSVSAVGTSLVFPPNDELEIGVVSLDREASGLHIESSSLHETSSGLRINPEWLELCGRVGGSCEAVQPLSAGERVSVYVRFQDAIPDGNYVGAINLAVKESPDTKSIELTSFSRSSARARWLGVAVLMLGLTLSLCGGTFARRLSSASSALLPAARLSELIARQREQLRPYANDVPITMTALDQLSEALSRDNLVSSGFVPRVLNLPLNESAVDTTKYAAYLQTQSDRLMALGFLSQHGFAVVMATRYEANNPSHLAARQKALSDLDELARSATKTMSELAVEIPPIILAWQGALKPPAPPGAAAAPQSKKVEAISDRPTLESLNFRIKEASIAAWLLSIVATLVSGYAVLIATNHGFGNEMDFVKCFLWGVGVQFAGQQVGELSPSSVATSLGFKAPAQ